MEMILALMQKLFVEPTPFAVWIVVQEQIIVMESVSIEIMHPLSHVVVTDVHLQGMYSLLHSPCSIHYESETKSICSDPNC